MKERVHLPVVLVLLLVLVPAWGRAQNDAGKKLLTLEEITQDDAAAPRPGQVRFTPDGRLSYLLDAEKDEQSEGEGSEDAEKSEESEDEDSATKKDDEDAGRDLWVLDVASGDKEIVVSASEMRRMAPSPGQAGVDERERTRRSRFGVAAYRWSPDGEKILFTSASQIWLYTPATKDAALLASSKSGVLDPKFSPDGSRIAFVYEHDIWVVPSDGGPERQLTYGGHDLLLHGDLDWVYPEELDVRTGYHWSPDGRHIAFLEMDESVVPEYPITEQIAWQATVDMQRYPKPGDPNPKVRVGIVRVDDDTSRKARTVWLDRAAEYIPRIDWADADNVAVQLLNRGQDELELVLADPSNGRSRSVFFDRDDHWIDVTKDLTFLDGGRFLWTSVRSGLRHIYLYGRDGRVVRQLTTGEFEVKAIEGFDEDAGWVYYSANEDNLLGSDLYRVKLDGTGKERLTEGRGTHRVDINDEATIYRETHSSLDITTPPVSRVHDLASGHAVELYRDRDVNAEYELVQPEILELKTEDDALVRVLLYKPAKLEPGKRYPVVFYVYGMAGFPVIRDASRGGARSLFQQFLVQEGYVVAFIDDRSSSIPGHKYAALADHDIGPVAAADHRVAVEHFRAQPWVDDERLGVWGWSGGGFTTAFHMGHTDLFKVGVAGAPVTDWRLYDSIYTERYMGLPEDDPEAYEKTSALNGAENVEGRLLLIHGTHDDNVHPQNTLKMMDALIRAEKQFDVMMYPNKTHGIRGPSHVFHLYTMIFEYFERHLR